MGVYVICEGGINANGNLDTAKRLIDAAAEAGANAIKWQKRTVEKVYTPEELAQPRESPFGATNGDLKRGLEFSLAQHAGLADYAKQRNLDYSASCWDVDSVQEIASLNPPWLKIPSALLTNKKLVEAYLAVQMRQFDRWYSGSAQPQTQIIISTGMSTWEEIDQCIAWLSPPGIPFRAECGANPNITLLHCHSSYPSPLDELNLACINSFKERYPGLSVGYSSHTVSPWPCLMAAVYGAEVIEFHLTLDRASWGSDQAASLEPMAAKKLIEEIRTWERCKGDGEKRVYASEEPIKKKLRR